jgi:MFS family permease
MAIASPTARLRQNRNWRLLWAGQAVSMIGDMVFYTTVMLWIATVIAKGEPWAPAAASGALMATAVPVLLLGPFAGVWVDRWDRRRTMLTADAARFALIACLLVVPLLGHHIPVAAQLAILYAVLVAASCFAQFFDPSRLAILGAIVPEADRAQASGQLSAAFSMSLIAGPPIAAPLLFGLGVQWALVVNAASFGVSFLCVRAIRVAAEAIAEPGPRASFAAEFRAGLRFFMSNKLLVALGIGLMVATLGDGTVNSLAVFFVQHNLHVAAKWLGTVIGAAGAGAIVGALSTGVLARRVRPPQIFWIALVCFGIALVGFARTQILPAAIGVAVVIGFSAGLLNAASSPIILSVTPSRLLGRVNAVIGPVNQLASIVSMALVGFLASTVLRGFHQVIAGLTFGPYDTIFTVAGLLFTIAGLALIRPMGGTVQALPADPGDGELRVEPLADRAAPDRLAGGGPCDGVQAH